MFDGLQTHYAKVSVGYVLLNGVWAVNLCCLCGWFALLVCFICCNHCMMLFLCYLVGGKKKIGIRRFEACLFLYFFLSGCGLPYMVVPSVSLGYFELLNLVVW